jgi:hypothetical protein
LGQENPYTAVPRKVVADESIKSVLGNGRRAVFLWTKIGTRLGRPHITTFPPDLYIAMQKPILDRGCVGAGGHQQLAIGPRRQTASLVIIAVT